LKTAAFKGFLLYPPVNIFNITIYKIFTMPIQKVSLCINQVLWVLFGRSGIDNRKEKARQAFNYATEDELSFGASLAIIIPAMFWTFNCQS
jgi:hypothetical protein